MCLASRPCPRETLTKSFGLNCSTVKQISQLRRSWALQYEDMGSSNRMAQIPVDRNGRAAMAVGG